MAVVNNYVFVPDMSAGSPNTGILRFDAANNYATTRFQSGTEYSRVSTGANGLLYAIQGNSSLDTIDVFNPQSMSLIKSVSVQGDSRAVAVDPSGDLYIANWDGKVYHYSAAGALLATRDLGFGNIDDIDISPTGQLVIGGRFGNVILTDTSLASQTSFKPSGTPIFVAFTSPVPEPASLFLLALGAAALLGRRRPATRRAAAGPHPRHAGPQAGVLSTTSNPCPRRRGVTQRRGTAIGSGVGRLGYAGSKPRPHTPWRRTALVDGRTSVR